MTSDHRAPNKARKSTAIVAAILAAALLVAGCGATSSEGGDTPGDASEPGSGTTARMTLPAGDDTAWFHHFIVARLMERLGYQIDMVDPVDIPVFFLSAARGEIDFWANGWFPLYNPYMEDERVQGKVEAVGYIVQQGALQGYLIDKATAEAHGIDNLADLRDPALAQLFDADGDGQADLIGCNPGWGCEKVIEHHLDAYDLRDTVEHVQGAYFALMGDALRRYDEGKPILFYTWTPNWTIHRLKPGKEVVWLEVPHADLPEAQKELEPYTEIEGVEGCVDDPCQMGWPANDIRIVANRQFLEANPVARRLFELIEVPLADIAAQNVRMYEGESSEKDVWRHADEWIEAHQQTIDDWLEAARQAGDS